MATVPRISAIVAGPWLASICWRTASASVVAPLADQEARRLGDHQRGADEGEAAGMASVRNMQRQASSPNQNGSVTPPAARVIQ